MNINFPENIKIFAKYLKVASGDIEEINQFIPSAGKYLINEEDVYDERIDNEILQPKFLDNDVKPYFIMEFG